VKRAEYCPALRNRGSTNASHRITTQTRRDLSLFCPPTIAEGLYLLVAGRAFYTCTGSGPAAHPVAPESGGMRPNRANDLPARQDESGPGEAPSTKKHRRGGGGVPLPAACNGMAERSDRRSPPGLSSRRCPEPPGQPPVRGAAACHMTPWDFAPRVSGVTLEIFVVGLRRA